MAEQQNPCVAPAKSWTWVCAALSASVALAGCTKQPAVPLPKTYPVTGTVADQDGKPMVSGSVEFQSTLDNNMRAMGEIKSDGRFSLETLVDVEKVSGAVEGPHAVTVLPFDPNDHGVLPIRLPKTYTVEPKENHFSLSLAESGQ